MWYDVCCVCVCVCVFAVSLKQIKPIRDYRTTAMMTSMTTTTTE